MALDGLQGRVAVWHRGRWPSCPLPVLAAKLAEECGEVCAEVVTKWESVVARWDGTGDKPYFPLDGLRAELAQVVVVALALADRAGFDLASVVEAEVARLEGGGR